MPTARSEGEWWQFRSRLPLGDGWHGLCAAPGHAGQQPTDEQQRDNCNLGYARGCARLPQQRPADAIRFSVVTDHQGRIRMRYVFELAHQPGEHGTLEYDTAAGQWVVTHPEARVQRLAECFLESYVRKLKGAPNEA